ncbi:TPA: hypothetical protein ACJTQ0_001731, partial [Streptococcus pyogenes]
VREHIEHCAACRQLEEDMRRQVPIEKAPQRALRFLKRVKRTRLIAAILSALVALFCIGWLYDLEFHYANTEAGRLEAVTIFLHRKATLFPVWKQELRFVQSRGKQ